MQLKQHILYLLVVLGICTVALGVDDSDVKVESLQLPDNQITEEMRQSPMPEMGEGRLSRMLSQYYTEGLGGREKWDEVSSLRLAGILEIEGEKFELGVYQKKPDLLKLTIHGQQSRHEDLVLAYDGETAWIQKPGREATPQLMPEDEARRFIHGCTFRDYLLYPLATGKTIVYVDTVPIEGSICHQIRVTLDTEYQVDYYLDIRSYLVVKVVSIDLRSGTSNSVIYKNYSKEFGIPIAMEETSSENGNLVSTVTINEVRVNAGVFPWMFEMREQ